MTDMRRDFNKVERDWASMGAAFAIPIVDLNPNVDPEQLICDILSAIPEHPRYAPLFVVWVKKFKSMIDLRRLQSMLSALPQEQGDLFRALEHAGDQNVNLMNLGPRLSEIVIRAHNQRLLPLAESKIKPFANVVSFNRHFSSRYN